jgi:hypothetical protein
LRLIEMFMRIESVVPEPDGRALARLRWFEVGSCERHKGLRTRRRVVHDSEELWANTSSTLCGGSD